MAGMRKNETEVGQDEVLAVKLAETPGASRGTDSDYLTAECWMWDKNNNCKAYNHKRDTPGVDE